MIIIYIFALQFKKISHMRIKQICKEKGITVASIAEKSKMPAPSISRIINGGNTTTDTLEKIASALDVSISELFEKPNENVVNCPNCGTRLVLKKEK
jgi:transcriptional regulator with XRE-family HTH domain